MNTSSSNNREESKRVPAAPVQRVDQDMDSIIEHSMFYEQNQYEMESQQTRLIKGDPLFRQRELKMMARGESIEHGTVYRQAQPVQYAHQLQKTVHLPTVRHINKRSAQSESVAMDANHLQLVFQHYLQNDTFTVRSLIDVHGLGLGMKGRQFILQEFVRNEEFYALNACENGCEHLFRTIMKIAKKIVDKPLAWDAIKLSQAVVLPQGLRAAICANQDYEQWDTYAFAYTPRGINALKKEFTTRLNNFRAKNFDECWLVDHMNQKLRNESSIKNDWNRHCAGVYNKLIDPQVACKTTKMLVLRDFANDGALEPSILKQVIEENEQLKEFFKEKKTSQHDQRVTIECLLYIFDKQKKLYKSCFFFVDKVAAVVLKIYRQGKNSNPEIMLDDKFPKIVGADMTYLLKNALREQVRGCYMNLNLEHCLASAFLQGLQDNNKISQEFKGFIEELKTKQVYKHRGFDGSEKYDSEFKEAMIRYDYSMFGVINNVLGFRDQFCDDELINQSTLDEVERFKETSQVKILCVREWIPGASTNGSSLYFPGGPALKITKKEKNRLSFLYILIKSLIRMGGTRYISDSNPLSESIIRGKFDVSTYARICSKYLENSYNSQIDSVLASFTLDEIKHQEDEVESDDSEVEVIGQMKMAPKKKTRGGRK